VLKNRGFEAYGIDKSQAMVDYSADKYPDISVKCADAEDALAFEKGSFSHILCMYFTVYYFKFKD
jgi:ubiquinone/menaquinone biosynthesis C-methylase UbiE